MYSGVSRGSKEIRDFFVVEALGTGHLLLAGGRVHLGGVITKFLM